MTTCDECGAYIDSDDDPECFVLNGTLCEKCRDELEECTCTTPSASIVATEPPSRRTDPHCPVHGNLPDPDDERDRRRDDEMWRREQERYETEGHEDE